MPEEINRIMCDHASTLLFSPTQAGVDNLAKEGFDLSAQKPYTIDNPGVFHCGDIMFDNSLYFSQLSDEQSNVLCDHNLQKENYVLSTIHRNDNTDQPERLSGIFDAILELIIKHDIEFILPLHPRTAKLLETNTIGDLYERIKLESRLKIIEPVSFLDMIALEKNAKIIVTDSGGVQKEAFFFKKPCVILRPETEWVELVSCGAARIVGWNKDEIIDVFDFYFDNDSVEFPELFGNGQSGRFMCEQMLANF
jgi:UDP-GlcNAc3NAcA epimerase